jgi:hypothetical protein
MAEAGVRCLPLKGGWLAESGLADGSRPAADLDVFVPAAHTRGALAVLSRLGYLEHGSTARHVRLVPGGLDVVVDARGEHPNNPRPVEVHPRVSASFRGLTLDLTDSVLNGDAEPVGLPAPVALAHLAAHASVDGLARRLRLLQLDDLTRAARALSSDDWSCLLELAPTSHEARFLWPSLALAARHVAAPVPSWALDTLGARVPARLLAWVDGVDPDALSRAARGDARRALLEVPTIWPVGWRERLRVWRFILLPSRADLSDRYGNLASGPLWPLAYARHAGYSLGVLAARLGARRRLTALDS